MFLVYVSIGLLIVSLIIVIRALISFRKRTEPTFTTFNEISEEMQERNNAIQTQINLMKEKQSALKYDLDWKKSVFTFTMREVKKLPNTFKSTSKQTVDEHDYSL